MSSSEPTPAGELPIADASSFTLDYYEELDGYIVGDYRGKLTEFKIPSKVNIEGEEYPVVGIADYAFYQRENVRRVVLPDTVRFIGDHSFSYSGITDLYATPSLFRVHEDAFRGTTFNYTNSNYVYYIPSLTNPYCVAFYNNFSAFGGVGDLNEQCESVTDGALTGFDALGGRMTFTPNLVSIGDCKANTWDYSKLPEGYEGTYKHLGSNALYGCTKIAKVSLKDDYPMGEGALSGASNLKKANLEKGVTAIGNEAFKGCKALTDIEMSSSLTDIGDNVFSGCSSLAKLNLPDTLVSIGDGAFTDCSALTLNAYENAFYLGNENNPYLGLVKAKDTSITSCEVASTCRFLASSSFAQCKKLTSISLPDSLKAIGKSAFYYASALSEIAIPDGVTAIGNSAFSRCSLLTSCDLPDSLLTLGTRAFYYCSALTSIEFPEYLVKIEEETFDHCEKLTEAVFSAGLETMGNSAFTYCRALTSIRIPSTVKSIGKNCFNSCSKLSEIFIPSSVTDIGVLAFSYVASAGNLYCEASAKPEGWKCDIPKGWSVHWGYTFDS